MNIYLCRASREARIYQLGLVKHLRAALPLRFGNAKQNDFGARLSLQASHGLFASTRDITQGQHSPRNIDSQSLSPLRTIGKGKFDRLCEQCGPWSVDSPTRHGVIFGTLMSKRISL